MSPEEFQRIKEAEKAHLRKLKELKQAARQLERTRRVQRAVTDLTDEQARLADEHRASVDRLALEAARSEARMEIALEAAAARAPDAPPAGDPDEALQAVRAQALVDQMKADLSAPTTPEATRAPADERAPAPTSSDEDAPPLPEKTIGRMRR